MKPTSILPRPQSGFGLIELMIAMTLGLVLLGSIGYVFIGSRGAFRVTDNLSRMQENARYALDVIGRDVRMAGYVGCGNIASMQVNTIANPPVPPMTAASALIGYDNGAGWTNPTSIVRPIGDVLSIMGAFGGEVNLTGNLAPSNSNVQINGNPNGYATGDVLVVTNCSTADVFKTTTVSGGGGSVTLNHSNSSNTGNRVGTYGADSFVMRMEQFTYFIGNNPAGNRALYRVGLNGQAEELVEHIENMQMRYGLDTTGDGAVNSYSNAPTNWAQVISVTISLLMRSPDNNLSTAIQTATFNNATFTAPDRRLYQVFSATVGVRNRLPTQ
ncbi:MAG: prepilin-type N-terminal cleavage/methylation domain-containing protein [Sulfuriferula multivorans]|uniref:Prepilin-type N-terminal cleavage/methylation domain-containing protein n=1 Tax=Sulfuriferula multivorans TaxID=1559896 RepID=A0A7C9P5N4_9PROT|nr:prepilin-type N-terminal cleavage/methylation domain-containing protein [Sulfuriferula multivorans]